MAKATAFISVFIGGGAGAVLRWCAENCFVLLFPTCSRAYGTLIVNMIGCFLAGIATGFFSKATILPTEISLLLVTGFLGGFTTFSTFTLQFLDRGWNFQGLIYLLISVAGGVFLAACGLMLAK